MSTNQADILEEWKPHLGTEVAFRVQTKLNPHKAEDFKLLGPETCQNEPATPSVDLMDLSEDLLLPDTQTEPVTCQRKPCPILKTESEDIGDIFLPDAQASASTASPVRNQFQDFRLTISHPLSQLSSYKAYEKVAENNLGSERTNIHAQIYLPYFNHLLSDIQDLDVAENAPESQLEGSNYSPQDTQIEHDQNSIPSRHPNTKYSQSHIQPSDDLFKTVIAVKHPAEFPECTRVINPSREKQTRNKLTCRERKKIAVPTSRPVRLTTAMKLWVSKTHALPDPFQTDEECWLHPSPPPAHTAANGSLRPSGKIQKSFSWQDRNSKHTIVLNFGIVHKLVFHTITKQQKDVFINKKWHLSHLCGNWTCLNSAHTTVEPGSVNIGRNNCFLHRSGCLHSPKCMKEMKVHLGADGKVVDHSAREGEFVPPEIDDWNDWMEELHDGEDVVGWDEIEELDLDIAGNDLDDDDGYF